MYIKFSDLQVWTLNTPINEILIKVNKQPIVPSLPGLVYRIFRWVRMKRTQFFIPLLKLKGVYKTKFFFLINFLGVYNNIEG